MKTLCTFLLWTAAMLSHAQPRTASDGVYVLNEDWFGVNNSTLNFWNRKEGTIDYRIIKDANRQPSSGNVNALGCTATYAQIYGGKLYAMSKQDQDSGEKSFQGGRFVIVNLDDMKVEHGFRTISTTAAGVSFADGRACLVVSPHKVYLGTSNGIYIYDADRQTISATPIEGTENELATGGESAAQGMGALYNNQIGNMIRGQDYVFAVKQDCGILVIDAVDDHVLTVIPGCFSAMVQSADGAIWAGMNTATGVDADGNRLDHYPYGSSAGEGWKGNALLRIDQYSLETTTVELTAGGIPQSWYAWTAGSFAAHPSRNVLYYVYSDPSIGQSSWFSAGALYRYDIDADVQEKVCDISDYGIHFYSSGVRVNPVDELLYGFYYSGGIANDAWSYFTIEDDGSDELTTDNERPLIANYWYPSLVVVPDTEAPVVQTPERLTIDGEALTIDLAALVDDADTPKASIVKQITNVADADIVRASLVRGNLLVEGLKAGQTTVTVAYDAAGQFAEVTFDVDVVTPSGITATESEKAALRYANGSLYATTAGRLQVYSASGNLLMSAAVVPSTPISVAHLTGIVMVKYMTNEQTYSYKLMLK